MRSQFIFYIAAVEAFAFPQIFPWMKQDATSCAYPVVYTVVEYPYVVQTWGPAVTKTITDENNNIITVTKTATETLTTLTSTSTMGHSRTTRTRTVKKPISTTITMQGEAASTTSQASTSITAIDTSTSVHEVISPTSANIIPPSSSTPLEVPTPSSTVASNSTQGCLPLTTNYPDVNHIPSNTTWLLQLYYLSNGQPISTGAYLTNSSGYTYDASTAVNVFLANGVLFAPDATYAYGWYATSSPAVDAPFALSQYLPNSGMMAKTFSFGNSFPYALTWDNCGFSQAPATFVLDQDAGQIVVVFDGNTNQGVTHEPVILGAVPACI